MKCMHVAVLSLGLLAGCNSPIEIQLPPGKPLAAPQTDAVLQVREDGRAQLARSSAPMSEAIQALGAPDSTRVWLQACSDRVDLAQISATVHLLQQAGYRNVQLRPAPRGSDCTAD